MMSLKLFVILGFLSCLALAQQGCNPDIKWRNCPRRTGGRCDACINVRFNNAANDRDVLCLKQQGNACIYTGNFLGDRSFAAVTGKTGVCQPFSNDPLEVSEKQTNFLLNKHDFFPGFLVFKQMLWRICG